MNLNDIKQQSAQYDEENKVKKDEITRRFKSLVTDHGVSAVSAATGLAESSVTQYMRCKVVLVSEYNVVKAENILNQ